MVGAEALRIGVNGPWVTKSYLEMILERRGVPRLNTPPLLSNTSTTIVQERLITAPKPLRIASNLVFEDLSQPWTQSPTKSQMEPVLATWHFVSPDPPLADGSVIATDPSSFRDSLQLVPMPDSYDLDRGLLLAVQAIQALLENKGLPVIVGIGKISLSLKKTGLNVDLLSRLHSPYLTDLLGYCADQHHRLLIFEFMPNGTLYHHLHPPRNQSWSLNWGTRLRIALDCARALEVLHEHSVPSIIHRDFKSSNVLLDQNFRAKVSDFGLAKTGSDKINGLISTRVLGTTGYLAPEYASTGKLTTKSDVYSYGVVLLELLTGRVPVDTNRPLGEHVLVSWALPRLTNREKVMEMVDPSLKGQYSKKDLIQVAAIAAMCVQPEADYRPLMTDVVQSLIPLVKNLSSVSLCSSSTSSLRFSQRVTPK
ncbi:hypothetical protein TEA_001058 [Camellia sinensis var. sinensis]|uniref:Protein kinase domain-containing protein n=1 Tax=Camellia sinensis var. sinensis TaxID=542762 RepID=A0A4S4EWQ1_CAMSN|nr:hypothetical protein TEA_001058 [Camellia sinensis var. sinensis]